MFLKILSKMGICTLASYRGSQLFEAVGLSPEVADLCCPKVTTKIGGAGFAELQEDLAARIAALEIPADSILLIDSRTPDWVSKGTIPGAVNLP